MAGPVVNRWLWPVLLLALTIGTYSDSFSGVLEGDAAALVATDSRVQSATLQNLHLIATRTYWSTVTSSNVYRPLVTLSWMLNYVGFGNQSRALGYHVFNLAFHLINVLLAWFLILRIWGEPWPAFLAAAIFAIHPVNTEAVTNVAGRADLMAASSVLGGLLLYIWLPEWTGWKHGTALAGLALISCFGLLSKENAVVLPAVMLLYDVLFRPRTALSRWTSYAAVVAPLVAIVAWRYWRLPGVVDGVVIVDNPIAAAGFWRGRLTAVEILWRYLGLLAWPQRLSWDYSYNQIPFATTFTGLLALAGMLALLGFLASLYRRAAPICFFGLFFFLAIAPTSNVLLLIGSIMAERFLYLPSIGFAVCVTAAVVAICERLPASRALWITAGAFSILLAALGVRTWVRNAEWTDAIRLWENSVEASPNSFKTHLAKINAILVRRVDLVSIDESIEEAKKAVAIVGQLPPAQQASQPLETLGSLYQLKANTLADQEGARGLSLMANMGGTTADSPQPWYDKALETFSQAAAVNDLLCEIDRRSALARGVPKERIRFGGSSFLYGHMGDTYRRLGRFREALEAFRHLAAIIPTNAGVYQQIAQVQQAMGSKEDAIVTLWQAQTLSPMEANEADLAERYRKLDPSGCAVVNDRPNPGCPLVKAHMCKAQTELVAGVTESGLPEEAARLREVSRTSGCPG